MQWSSREPAPTSEPFHSTERQTSPSVSTTQSAPIEVGPTTIVPRPMRERGPTKTGPISLTDSFGRTVELDEPAQRVVVLEWQQIEDVLSLCVAPVGVADVEGYTTWSTAETLPQGTTDVGMRGEPNLDALYATNPDLVIIEAYTPDEWTRVVAWFDSQLGPPAWSRVQAEDMVIYQKGEDEAAITVSPWQPELLRPGAPEYMQRAQTSIGAAWRP